MDKQLFSHFIRDFKRLVQSYIDQANLNQHEQQQQQEQKSKKQLHKKHRKDPNEPKQPSTPYFQFLNTRRSVLMNGNPNLKITDVSQLVSKEWQQLTSEQKIPYQDLYQQDKGRYCKEMELFKNKKFIPTSNASKRKRKIQEKLKEVQDRTTIIQEPEYIDI